MEYSESAEAFRKELAPQGLLENLLADEIIYAAARLRNCADDDDRSRAFAHRILRISVADLRRLQTDRRIREELDPDLPATGLAGYRELIAAHNARAAFDLRTRKLHGTDTVSKIIDSALPKSPTPEQFAAEAKNWVRSAPANSTVNNQPAPSPNTPRNASCPCGSSEKFKRCCGKNAPPVLSPGIAKAA